MTINLEELTEQTIATVQMVLEEVKKLPEDEQQAFWDGFTPEQIEMCSKIMMINSIRDNLPGIKSIAFASDEDPDDSYSINLYPGKG